MAQTERIDERQGSEKTIDQAAHSKQALWNQHPSFALDCFEVSERGERAHVARRKDVLWRLRHLETERFRELQGRVPKMGEITDHEAG